MAHVVLPRLLGTKTIAVERLSRRANSIQNTDTAKWFIRYTFYAFVFWLPFEESSLIGGATLSRVFGLALAAFALLQPHLCYKFPPKAFWWFVAYLSIFVLSGSYLILFPPNVPDFSRSFISLVFRLIQLLVLFWISYNLMRQEKVVNASLWALAAGTICLAVLQLLGITGNVGAQDRETAFEANPNNIATILSLGFLALFGLAYGRGKQDWKGCLLFWLSSGILAVAMVRTGSRGVVVALVVSLSVFYLRGKTLVTKVKFGLIALAGIVFLAVASYRIEAVRVRWEKTFYDQSLANRERIFPATIGMILESPLTGWGPLIHKWELGPRVGFSTTDEHNVYLSLLAEVGLLGAMPFFAGLWLCWRSAWRARYSIQGILPLVMLLFILAVSMKSSIHYRKYYWVILSYALAAGTCMISPKRSKTAVFSAYDFPHAMRRRYKPMALSRTGRRRRISRSF